MTSPLLSDQRAALQAVTTAATATLTAEWAGLDILNAIATREALVTLVFALADHYGAAATVLASDTYTVARAEAGVAGSFTLRPAGVAQRLRAAIGWGVEPLFGANPDGEMARYRVAGSLQKSVADQYRDTVEGTALDDPKADGWQRVARSDGCPFCVMLASRGAVYSEATVDFGAHRDCHCLAVPAFTGRERPVKRFTPKAREITAADRAATNRWADAHL